MEFRIKTFRNLRQFEIESNEQLADSFILHSWNVIPSGIAAVFVDMNIDRPVKDPAVANTIPSNVIPIDISTTADILDLGNNPIKSWDDSETGPLLKHGRD